MRKWGNEEMGRMGRVRQRKGKRRPKGKRREKKGEAASRRLLGKRQFLIQQSPFSAIIAVARLFSRPRSSFSTSGETPLPLSPPQTVAVRLPFAKIRAIRKIRVLRPASAEKERLRGPQMIGWPKSRNHFNTILRKPMVVRDYNKIILQRRLNNCSVSWILMMIR